MKAYLDIVKKVIDKGVEKDDRTGVGTIAIAGAMFEHDMIEGFPLVTTKSVPFRLVASELEFFIKGITDKKWLQDRNNHIWDEWCSPTKVPYAHDDETKKKMAEERDLGPIYGAQWRSWPAPDGRKIDQLSSVLEQIANNPDSRRLLVSAWNVGSLDEMALSPCHALFQFHVVDGKLSLQLYQRSADLFLGVPFNIASYSFLTHILNLHKIHQIHLIAYPFFPLPGSFLSWICFGTSKRASSAS